METITPEENRMFTTSLGNWEGDGEWQEDPQYPPTGLMAFTFEARGAPQHSELTYPHIAPIPGKSHAFVFAYGRLGPPSVGPCDWLITDGVYSFGGSGICPPEFARVAIQGTLDIPSDWNQGATSLQITIHADPDSQTVGVVKGFTLHYAPTHKKIDYLPLVGVG